MKRVLYGVVPALLLSACGGQPEAVTSPEAKPAEAAAVPPQGTAPERPMDEVPVQATLSNGDREYAFANGCRVVLDSKRAVVKQEGDACESHHRDIALLYGSGD
ncbi:hypothetical protein [Xanthomonas sp. 60]